MPAASTSPVLNNKFINVYTTGALHILYAYTRCGALSIDVSRRENPCSLSLYVYMFLNLFTSRLNILTYTHHLTEILHSLYAAYTGFGWKIKIFDWALNDYDNIEGWFYCTRFVRVMSNFKWRFKRFSLSSDFFRSAPLYTCSPRTSITLLFCTRTVVALHCTRVRVRTRSDHLTCMWRNECV